MALTTTRTLKRTLAALVVALTASLSLASAAQATPTVSEFTVSPGTANAGATGTGKDVSVHIKLAGTSGTGQDLRDLTIHLPPGLVANPQAAPKCTVAQLNGDNCPAASQVGEVANSVDAYVVPGVPIPQNVTGSLYNLVAQPGEPGRFGIVLRPLGGLLPKVILQSGAALRDSDFGLDSILKNLPTSAGGLAIDIKSLDLTLYGKAGATHNQGNFVRLPTSCGSNTFGVDATNYSSQSASATTNMTTQNCTALPFSPELSATIGAPGKTAANTLPPVTTQIAQTIQEAGLKQAKVSLPFGISGNASYLISENYCAPATFESNPAACPPSSVIGQATAASPLLADPLVGPLVLVDTTPTTPLPTLGLDLDGALHLKLFGDLGIGTNSDGQVVTGVTFSTLPDIPIANFKLAFKQDGLNIVTRDICKPPGLKFDANFTSFADTQFHTQPQPTIAGCGGGPAGKKPKAKLALSHGAGKQPRATLKLTAGKKKIRKLKLTLPAKLKPAGKAAVRKHSVVKANGKKLKSKAISKKGRSVGAKLGKARKAKLRLGRGALRPSKAKPGSKLRVKVAITDTSGTTTKLTKTVRAKR